MTQVGEDDVAAGTGLAKFAAGAIMLNWPAHCRMVSLTVIMKTL